MVLGNRGETEEREHAISSLLESLARFMAWVEPADL